MNLSLTDPAVRWAAAPGGPAFNARSTNYLMDVHAGVIPDVDATAAHRTEAVNATETMIHRGGERFDRCARAYRRSNRDQAESRFYAERSMAWAFR